MDFAVILNRFLRGSGNAFRHAVRYLPRCVLIFAGDVFQGFEIRGSRARQLFKRLGGAVVSNHGAGFIGHLAVRHCTRSRQFHLSATRGSYVFFA
jgi:hypothetical protein